MVIVHIGSLLFDGSFDLLPRWAIKCPQSHWPTPLSEQRIEIRGVATGRLLTAAFAFSGAREQWSATYNEAGLHSPSDSNKQIRRNRRAVAFFCLTPSPGAFNG